MLALRAAALLLAFSLTAQAQPSKLVGTWELAPGQDLDVETASLGPELTFGTDGTLSVRFASPPPGELQPPSGTYTADGDTIWAVVDGREQPARYWFDKLDLVIAERGQELRWRRTTDR